MDSGKLRVTFNVAANLRYRDKSGDWQQEATFVPVSVWDKLAEYVAEGLHKGSAIFLTGRLKSRTFKTPTGNRTVLEVIARHVQFLDKKAKGEQENAPPF